MWLKNNIFEQISTLLKGIDEKRTFSVLPEKEHLNISLFRGTSNILGIKSEDFCSFGK
jgi:hypothetical protein